MKRISFLITAIFAIAAFVSFANVSAKDGLAIGSTLENFDLTDTKGTLYSFNHLKGKNGAIIVFLSVQCPVVKGYNERIVKIAEDYKAKGINVIGINSNSTETLDKVKLHAAENYKFPVLIDKNNVLADRFGANVTPEMFYFNGKNVLTYHGAIDNDRSGKNVTTDFLRTALDESLSGKAVTKSTANAFGCSIKRAEKN
ncbi:MAG TPA: redoxin domain-containing protein [Pyrinomonadaceae bacterium]|nr:redoxin domain-containing protein [Pyrinomonadaceae bacterium]